jgi:hypothetical protein
VSASQLRQRYSHRPGCAPQQRGSRRAGRLAEHQPRLGCVAVLAAHTDQSRQRRKLQQMWTFPGVGGSSVPVVVNGVSVPPAGRRIVAVDGDTGKKCGRSRSRASHRLLHHRGAACGDSAPAVAPPAAALQARQAGAARVTGAVRADRVAVAPVVDGGGPRRRRRARSRGGVAARGGWLARQPSARGLSYWPGRRDTGPRILFTGRQPPLCDRCSQRPAVSRASEKTARFS